MNKELIGYLTLIIATVQFTPYLWLILTGKIRPHIFTRLIWGVTTSVAFYAQYTENGGPGAWSTGLTSFVCFLSILFCLRTGDKHITRGDWIALVLSVSATPLWCVTRNPLWSVILVTVIDGVGYYPTFRKCWSRPHDEMIYAFSLGCVRTGLAIVALENYNLTTLLYPSFCVVSDALFIGMLVYRRRQLKPAEG